MSEIRKGKNSQKQSEVQFWFRPVHILSYIAEELLRAEFTEHANIAAISTSGFYS